MNSIPSQKMHFSTRCKKVASGSVSLIGVLKYITCGRQKPGFLNNNNNERRLLNGEQRQPQLVKYNKQSTLCCQLMTIFPLSRPSCTTHYLISTFQTVSPESRDIKKQINILAADRAWQRVRQELISLCGMFQRSANNA